MPNQRAKNKTYLGGFIDKKLHRRLTQMARRGGMANNRFGFLMSLALETINRQSSRKAVRSPAARPKPGKASGMPARGGRGKSEKHRSKRGKAIRSRK